MDVVEPAAESSRGWVGFLTSRMGAWLVLLGMVLVTAVVMGPGRTESSEEPPVSLPADSESARVDDLLARFPGRDTVPAGLVVTRADGAPLGPRGLRDAADIGERVAGTRASEDTGTGGPQIERQPVEGPIPSPDGAAAMLLVPIRAELAGSADGAELIGRMREEAARGLDPSMRAQITGGPAFAADTAAAFEGADLRLLLATAAVVAVLLVITYRSPVLWLVPLLVVAVADRVAAVLTTAIGASTGVTLDASTAGITSVLVFGAGTNYALLLVSRYREELHRQDDRRRALRRAYRGALPAVLSSNVTVVLALLTLLLAALPNYRSLGLSGSVGLLVAVVYALVALPAALAVCGRGLFWPFVPRPQTPAEVGAGSPPIVDAAPSSGAGHPPVADVAPGSWGRVARAVSPRAVPVLVAGVVLLLALSTGLLGARIGLDQTEQFRTESEAVTGLETLSEHFPAGSSDPVIVVADTGRARAVLDAVDGTEGVQSVRQAGTSPDGLTRLDVVVDSATATDRSDATIRSLREAVHAVPDAGALVGGSAARAVDGADGNVHDLRLLVPLILVVVFVVLVAVLRAVVAPLLILGATVLSSLAALGLGTFVTTTVLGFPGLDLSVPLFSFLFLVALGVDYSIFLALRAREEAFGHGTREGMLRAVSLTGGLVTSAGVVLASVFVVLGVLPLVVLTQIGVIVALGVLIDTLLVRTVLVPAMFAILGDRVWWPGRAPGADPLPA